MVGGIVCVCVCACVCVCVCGAALLIRTRLRCRALGPCLSSRAWWIAAERGGSAGSRCQGTWKLTATQRAQYRRPLKTLLAHWCGARLVLVAPNCLRARVRARCFFETNVCTTPLCCCLQEAERQPRVSNVQPWTLLSSVANVACYCRRRQVVRRACVDISDHFDQDFAVVLHNNRFKPWCAGGLAWRARVGNAAFRHGGGVVGQAEACRPMHVARAKRLGLRANTIL